MDEVLDILNANGNLTGTTTLKSIAHRDGLFHRTVHIWFYTLDGLILLQQRGKDKAIYPLLWDVSVAGHIGAGESIEIAALREIQEEIGITVSTTALQKIGVFKSVKKHKNGLNDCEFHHTFICILEASFEKLRPQESEVEAIKLISTADFFNDVLTKKNSIMYVPHSPKYYRAVHNNICDHIK